MRIANYFRQFVHPEDREDMFQDILLEMMERERRNGGLPERDLWRAAKCVRERYRKAYRRRDGKLLSLNAPVSDGETGPWELIPDRRVLDLAAWLDARAELRKCPPRAVRIALKLTMGKPVSNADRAWLTWFRRKAGERPQRRLPVLGAKITELRQRRGWTQLDLERHSGVSQPRISMYEAGVQTSAMSGCLEGLAAALGVSPG